MSNLAPLIEQIKARTDILETIGRLVSLKKGGKSYQGLCPFHQEKTPSFHVYAESQRYHCFGCQKDGDLINFVQDYYNISFKEAISKLAKEKGLEYLLKEVEDRSDKVTAIPLAPLKRLLESVTCFYEQSLDSQMPNSAAVASYQTRNISENIKKIYRLGWSAGFHALEKAFPGQEQQLITVGLLKQKDRLSYQQLFIERLMFPIRSADDGQVLGFGARQVLPDPEKRFPKYINSPETILFKKNTILYGLYEALQHRKFKSFIIVEGYFDVLQLAQAGFLCGVAPMGTAIASSHIEKLQRYRRELIFCFDGDAAGQKAAERTLEIALPFYKHDFQASFVIMPPDEDPDSFIRKKGRQSFIELCQKRVKIGEYLFFVLENRYPPDQIDSRVQFLTEAQRLIGLVEDATARLALKEALQQHSFSSAKKIKWHKKPEHRPSLKTIGAVELLALMIVKDASLRQRLSEELKTLLSQHQGYDNMLGPLLNLPPTSLEFAELCAKMRAKYCSFYEMLPSESLDLVQEFERQLASLRSEY